ncbi:MAG: hypothetical protein IAE89_15655 [Anaerolineae bacterium]|nr:hypothetical protein [Anaerolineae bacterium]
MNRHHDGTAHSGIIVVSNSLRLRGKQIGKTAPERTAANELTAAKAVPESYKEKPPGNFPAAFCFRKRSLDQQFPLVVKY